MTSRSHYFTIEHRWPEGYASLIIERDSSSKVSHLDVYKGICKPDYLTNFRVVDFSKGNLPDMLPNNLGWSIVSARCCKRFSEVDADIKATLHPLDPILPPECRTKLSGYCLLSAAMVLDCLDLSSDTVDWFDDQTHKLAKSFTALRLIGSKIPDRISFFGLRRVPCVHIISSPLCNILQADRLTGFTIQECEVVAKGSGRGGEGPSVVQ